jgi:hypothetical protein
MGGATASRGSPAAMAGFGVRRGGSACPFIGAEEGEGRASEAVHVVVMRCGRRRAMARQQLTIMASAACRAGSWRGRVAAARGAREERVGLNQGRGGWVWPGARRVASQVAASAYGAAVGRAQGGGEERDEVEGIFVNKENYMGL